MSTSDPTKPIKLFISHASEDKEDFVEPLEAALGKAGFDLWYDKDALKLTDSLFQRISMGLAECDFGVVVLSQSFFRKKWTQAEVGGLFALETTERKIIIPIWKDVTERDVKEFSPLLADRLGILAAAGVDAIVDEIKRLVQVSERTSSFSGVENEIARFAALDKRVAGAQAAMKLSESVEGVAVVREAAKGVIGDLKTMIEKLAISAETLELVIKQANPFDLIVKGSFNVDIIVQFSNSIQNSISRDELSFRVYQRSVDIRGNDSNSEIVRRKFKPEFHHSGVLLWHGRDNSQFTNDQLSIHLLATIVDTFGEVHDRQERSRPR